MSDSITISEAGGTWVVRGGGAILGETDDALRLEQTGRDPVIFFPRDDIAMALLEPSPTRTEAPGIGEATHFSLQTKSMLIPDVAWSFESPSEAARAIARHLAFRTDKVAVERI